MKRVVAVLAVSSSFVLLLTGCGGGGHSGSKSLARQRAVTSTRVMRATMAVAGFGKKLTRAAPATLNGGRVGMGSRVPVLLAALRRTRATDQGQDASTGLYYVLTVNDDGSGRQDLFTDAAHQKPAGFLSWPAPDWHGGQPGAYPAVLHVTFQITAGDFAGCHGTMDVTVNDPAGASGVLHVVLENAYHEKADADLDCQDGMITGQNQVSLPDGSQYEEQDEVMGDVMQCTISYPDGSSEVIKVQDDGSGSETIYESNGTVDATGDFEADGFDTIDYSDGTDETVDVDTGEDVPDNSGDSSNGGDSSDPLRVHRAAHRAPAKPAPPPGR